MMREGRVASLGLLGAMPRSSGVTFSEPETQSALRAWQIAFHNGDVIYARNRWVSMRAARGGPTWIDLVAAPEIFVA